EPGVTPHVLVELVARLEQIGCARGEPGRSPHGGRVVGRARRAAAEAEYHGERDGEDERGGGPHHDCHHGCRSAGPPRAPLPLCNAGASSARGGGAACVGNGQRATRPPAVEATICPLFFSGPVRPCLSGNTLCRHAANARGGPLRGGARIPSRLRRALMHAAGGRGGAPLREVSWSRPAPARAARRWGPYRAGSGAARPARAGGCGT